MRKSNSRETRRAVEAYVLEEIEAINERTDQEPTTRPVTAAFETMREEMDYQSYIGPASDRPVYGAGLAAKYAAAGRHDHYTAATPYRVMWLYAAIGELEAYTGPIYQRLREWLDETHEESSRYTDTEAEKLFYHLTASAFERLYERENTPHRVSTADFIRLYQAKNGGHFFDRETLKHWGQTRRSFTVEAFQIVTDSRDSKQHDCYAVFHTLTAPTGEKFPRVAYFDRVTLEEVFPVNA